MKNKERKTINVSEFEADYAPDTSIWTEDSERMQKIKQIINNLPLPEKRVFILYSELGSLRAVAQQWGVGLTTTMKEINVIKNKIIKQLEQ